MAKKDDAPADGSEEAYFEGADTDELFEDHPEAAPDESRISVETGRDIGKESIRRRANTGDIVDDAGDEHRVAEINFDRNQDFGGNAGALSTDADFTRGSGYVGSELVGEENPTARGIPGTRPDNVANLGFETSAQQDRNIEAIQRDQESRSQGRKAEPSTPKTGFSGDPWMQGRDLGRREQVTVTQRFGRDIGASGLSHEDAYDAPQRPGSMGRDHKDWTAVLGKLGGSSPGSEENLRLAEVFGKVQFPALPGDVLARLEGGKEFRIGKDIILDLRHAVANCRKDVFRNVNEVIDCVKDELRRMETVEPRQG